MKKLILSGLLAAGLLSFASASTYAASDSSKTSNPTVASSTYEEQGIMKPMNLGWGS